MTDLSQLGDEIRKAREAQGLTQEELGEHLGLSGSAVGLLEVGRIEWPPLPVLTTIAQVLHVDPAPLYELAGLTLTDSQSASARVQWVTEQLDAEGTELFLEMGYALLRWSKTRPSATLKQNQIPATEDSE